MVATSTIIAAIAATVSPAGAPVPTHQDLGQLAPIVIMLQQPRTSASPRLDRSIARRILTSRHAGAIEFGSDSRRLTIGYQRQRRTASGALPTMVVARGSLDYRMATAGGGAFTLSATEGSIRRRRPLALGDGRWHSASREAVEAAWENADGLRLAAGWEKIGAGKSRGAITRQILLAAGAPLAESGPRLSASIGEGKAIAGAWRLGVELDAYQVSNVERAAFVVPSSHDARATISFRLAFR